jgi:Cu+-exporting ATPase
VGGTVNGRGFVMRAERVGSTRSSRGSSRASPTRSARARRSSVSPIASGLFVPAVVLVAVLAFVVWAAAGPDPRLAHALVSAVSVLIIACPCALGLATPMSIMVATGCAARAGILFRSAEAIERMETIDVLAIDKTGTLTEGRPKLVAIVAAPGAVRSGTSGSPAQSDRSRLERGSSGDGSGASTGSAAGGVETASATTFPHPGKRMVGPTTTGGAVNPDEAVIPAAAIGPGEEAVLRLAAGIERASEHPLAGAILDEARRRGVDPPPVAAFRAMPGRGVAGTVEGRPVLLGTARMLEQAGVDLAPLLPRADEERAQGRTVVFLAHGGALSGLLSVADPIKPGAAEAIRALHAEGLRIVMITGDGRASAEAVARQLGIDEVVAEVLPEEKSAIVQGLQREGRKVAMAGDGINDAPALARADIGIAMGTGTDVAIESAAVTLVKGDLRGIVRARRLGRATMRNIRQNLAFAFVYNLIGVPIAAGVLFPILGVTMNPMLASAAMSLSSVSVIANALRLRAARLDPDGSAGSR